MRVSSTSSAPSGPPDGASSRSRTSTTGTSRRESSRARSWTAGGRMPGRWSRCTGRATWSRRRAPTSSTARRRVRRMRMGCRDRRAKPRAAGPGMIDGVVLKLLTVHADDRGLLMEVVRDDEPVFRSVKQTTFTIAHPGVIKAFHWHKRQWDVWFFSSGMAQVVLYDLREGSPTCRRTEVFYMGERRPAVLAIPPGVAHG